MTSVLNVSDGAPASSDICELSLARNSRIMSTAKFLHKFAAPSRHLRLPKNDIFVYDKAAASGENHGGQQD